MQQKEPLMMEQEPLEFNDFVEFDDSNFFVKRIQKSKRGIYYLDYLDGDNKSKHAMIHKIDSLYKLVDKLYTTIERDIKIDKLLN